MQTFAESYLLELLGDKLLLEPSHAREMSRGIELALAENRGNPLTLARLAESLERIGTSEEIVVVNLWNTPLTLLWVRAALQKAKHKLTGLPRAQVVIVGLWQILKGPGGRRTAHTEERFQQWRSFVETQLIGTRVGQVSIVWVG